MKILFLSQDGKIGDAIVNTAFVAALAGKAELHVTVNGATADFWGRDKRIHRCWLVQRPGWGETVKLGLALRREGFDAIVTWLPLRKEKNKLLLWLAKARRVIDLREWRKGPQGHKVEDCAEVLRQLGQAVPDSLRYEIGYPIGQGSLPAAPYVLLNVFAADAERTLMPEAALALARGLRAGLPQAKLVLSATADSHQAAQAIADLTGAIVWNTDRDLAGLFRLCRGAALVISPDTALVHIASAYGVPVIGIYQNNGVKAVQWGPYGVNGAAVLSDNPDTVHGFSLDELLAQAAALFRTPELADRPGT